MTLVHAVIPISAKADDKLRTLSGSMRMGLTEATWRCIAIGRFVHEANKMDMFFRTVKKMDPMGTEIVDDDPDHIPLDLPEITTLTDEVRNSLPLDYEPEVMDALMIIAGESGVDLASALVWCIECLEIIFEAHATRSVRLSGYGVTRQIYFVPEDDE